MSCPELLPCLLSLFLLVSPDLHVPHFPDKPNPSPHQRNLHGAKVLRLNYNKIIKLSSVSSNPSLSNGLARDGIQSHNQSMNLITPLLGAVTYWGPDRDSLATAHCLN